MDADAIVSAQMQGEPIAGTTTRVLVTGASGFIGVPALAALAMGRSEIHALTTRPSPPPIPGVHWHRGDLADGPAIERLIAELAPQRLVHLAWYVEHGRFWEAPENLLWVEQSLHLVRSFARAGGRRAVLLGTCAEYDWASADRPMREAGSPIAPSTLYGVAKDALRRLCCSFAAREGFELAWGRLFFPYGPRDDHRRLIPSVIRSLLAGEPVKTTAGTQQRDFIHVADVGRAIALLLDSAATGPVNIASGQSTAVADVVDRLAAAIGRPELVLRGELPERANEPALLVADIERLREEVGFVPAFSLAEGLLDTIQWWRHPSAAPARA